MRHANCWRVARLRRHMQTVWARLQDWALEKGIASEVKKAGLMADRIALGFGELAFLRSATANARYREAVLMLHGAAADNSSWVRFSHALGHGLPQLIPDLPGHGKSVAKPGMEYGIGVQAVRMAQFLAAQGVERVHVIASSMGGAIALRLAADQPQLVASLMLIGAVGMQADESWLQRSIRDTGRNPMLTVRNKQDYEEMIRIGMAKPLAIAGFIVSALARQYMRRLPINEQIGRDINIDLDQSAAAASIACPALILWGRQDRVSDVSNAALLHRTLRDSEVEILDDVGHVPMVEAPQRVAELCRRFLDRVAVPA